jgi:hypothetical protein
MTDMWTPSYPHWDTRIVESSGKHLVIEYYFIESPEKSSLRVIRDFQWTPAKFALVQEGGSTIPAIQGNIVRLGPGKYGPYESVYYEIWLNTSPSVVDYPEYAAKS